MRFDPESYSITIRKEEIDNDILNVGRVAEFPNISVYEEDFEIARNLIIDAIQTLKKLLMKPTQTFRSRTLHHRVNFVSVFHLLAKEFK